MRDYNFFSAYDKKKELRIGPSSPYFIAGIILVLAVLATAGLVGRNMLLERDIQALQDETAALQATASYQEAQALNAAWNSLVDYETSADAALADFEANDVSATAFLDRLTAALPSTVTLDSISADHAYMMATFQVPDKRTAAELVLRLEESGLFESVHMPSVSQRQGQVAFLASVNCVRKAGEEE